ncbi:hypothetical protein Y032_0180g792 [Ancylostoma ceylanicum]|uniref:Uncharacterized protein n=1 Tax=Ancylostoma ceylanicum TaxID=53326 RepID=A0A016SSF6_9BILA|nr:hypothetical protein Y032_0180g792 [Ancylostoma ceylanicum]
MNESSHSLIPKILCHFLTIFAKPRCLNQESKWENLPANQFCSTFNMMLEMSFANLSPLASQASKPLAQPCYRYDGEAVSVE